MDFLCSTFFQNQQRMNRCFDTETKKYYINKVRENERKANKEIEKNPTTTTSPISETIHKLFINADIFQASRTCQWARLVNPYFLSLYSNLNKNHLINKIRTCEMNESN